MREIRALVTKQLEERRAAGAIGSSLQAEVVVAAPGADLELLRSLGDDLKFVLITSQAARARAAPASPAVEVRAERAPKCERCWHWRADVGADRRHATICARCVAQPRGPRGGAPPCLSAPRRAWTALARAARPRSSRSTSPPRRG